MGLTLRSEKTLQAGSTCDILLSYQPEGPIRPAGGLWLFWDIRQDAGWLQTDDEDGNNYLKFRRADGRTLPATVHNVRTLDLYPAMPEFTGLAECRLEPESGPVEIAIARWQVPPRPIAPFRFWLLPDPEARWDFQPIGFRRYRLFVDRLSGARTDPELVAGHLQSVPIQVAGEYPPVPPLNHRKTPGVFWGEIHGMAFNQRPFDDFYDYARQITRLDFGAAMLFSYNTCVGGVWQEIKDAARRHTVPGEFIAFVGFECGTPPDDSHRCAYFPAPEKVPPIFCDSRGPARDPMLQKRFHPDTILCRTLDEFYDAVHRYGGFVGGHHHTLAYDRELLAEMWQKQNPGVDEEERVFQYLREGKRFGLVGGSDTHDSMPGNPAPEPSCPRPAGFTGVWAEELTPEALSAAFRSRRVFATSGARILLAFHSSGHPMGSQLPIEAPRRFSIQVDGTGALQKVELLCDGQVKHTWEPAGSVFQTEFEVPEAAPGPPAFYLVRVRQQDGHIAWSSPIWFG